MTAPPRPDYAQPVTTISTEQAEELLDEGTTFLDVRTTAEYADGHIPGSFNVPVSVEANGGLQPNLDFVAVVQGNFEKSHKMVILCRAGARSARAITLLKGAGYSNIFDMTAGMSGTKDTFGQVILGWQAEGRELSTECDEGRTYPELLAKL